MKTVKVSLILLVYFLGIGSVSASNKIAFGNGIVVALDLNPRVEGKVTLTSAIRYSVDYGKTWNNPYADSDKTCTNQPLNAVKYLDEPYGGKQFVVVGHDGTTCYSTDGKNWAWHTRYIYERVPNNALHDIANAIVTTTINGEKKDVPTVAAVGQDGETIYSIKDFGWSWRLGIADRPNDGYNLNSITYGNDKFVAVGDYDTIAYSADGIHWNGSVIKDKGNLTHVIYAKYPNLFVALDNNSKIWTSSDGIHWKTGFGLLTPGNNSAFVDVAYGPGVGGEAGLFVAVANGKVTSTKGIFDKMTEKLIWYTDDEFSLFGNGVLTNLTSIIYSDEYKKFIATYEQPPTHQGGIAYSIDGRHWSRATIKKAGGQINIGPLAAIIATDKNLIAIPLGQGLNFGSYVLTSTDPTSWQATDEW